MNRKCDSFAVTIRNEQAPPIDWKPAPEIPVGGWAPYQPPMTLRDYFAGQALAGMLAKEPWFNIITVGPAAYHVADAMIAARDAKS
jgi:hypothetical protein